MKGPSPIGLLAATCTVYVKPGVAPLIMKSVIGEGRLIVMSVSLLLMLVINAYVMTVVAFHISIINTSHSYSK